MKDDQSFYEIQLNTPHLVAAFLGAVVVGMAVFWFGLVIGRGQTETGPPQDWQAAVPNEEAAPVSGEEPLEFYDGVQEPTTETQPAADTDTAQFAPAEPVDPLPLPESEPEPVQTPTAPTPEPVETPTVPTPAPVERPAAPTPLPSTTLGGLPQPDLNLASGWIVQVRSTTDKASADELQALLVADGFPAYVVSAEVQGDIYYRVRVGRYRSQTDARSVETNLGNRSYIAETWVTEG